MSAARKKVKARREIVFPPVSQMSEEWKLHIYKYWDEQTKREALRGWMPTPRKAPSKRSGPAK